MSDIESEPYSAYMYTGKGIEDLDLDNPVHNVIVWACRELLIARKQTIVPNPIYQVTPYSHNGTPQS